MWLADKHMNRCSTGLAIRETKIETFTNSQLTPIGKAERQASDNTKCWQEGRKTPQSYTAVGSL